MAIAYRDIAYATTSTQVVNRPTNTQNDDVLLFVALIQNGGTITPPAGWTLVDDTTGSGASAVTLHVYWHLAASGDPSSWTFTKGGSGNHAYAIIAYSGCDTASPIGPKAEASSHTAPSVTSLTTNCMLVCIFGTGGTTQITGSAATWTAPSGMTNRTGTNTFKDTTGNWFVTGNISDLIIAAAGATGSKAASISDAQFPGSQSILLIPADAAPPVEQDKTTAQRFYLTNTDQDQAWGTDIDKLSETAGSTLTTTITTHANSAGTTTVTVDPYSSVSATTDLRTNLGWAINEAGTDGMNSESDAKRVIPAGTWTFFNRVTYAAGGLVTGGHFITLECNVYRVATGGGTRTLLFTQASAEQAGTNGGATASITTNATGKPAYTLEAGETIHVAYRITDRQVAGTLGGTTAGNNVLITGGDADAYVQVPAPGIRTAYALAARAGATTPSGSLIKTPIKVLAANVASSSGVIIKTIRIFDSAIVPGAGEVIKRATRILAGAASSAGAIIKRPTRIFSSTQTPGPSTLVRKPVRLLSGSVASSSTVARFIQAFKTGSITPSGAVFKQYRPIPKTGSITPGPGSLIRRPGKLLQSSVTPGPGTIIRRVTKLATGNITPGVGVKITKVVRNFIAGVTPGTGVVLKRPSRTFTGSAASSGAIVKRPTRIFSSSVTPSPGVIQALLRKNVQGSIAPTGTVTKKLFSFFTGSVTPTGSLRKTLKKFLTGYFYSTSGGEPPPPEIIETPPPKMIFVDGDPALHVGGKQYTKS